MLTTYDTRKDLYAGEFPSGGIGCEIGVLFGDNAVDLLDACSPRQLHLIDAWAPLPQPSYGGDKQESQTSRLTITRNRFMDRIVDGSVVIHVAPSMVVLPCLMPIFDWMYLDGDHRYPSVLDDLHQSASKLTSDGILAGHDYYKRDDWETSDNGVYEAVRVFTSKTAWRLAAVSRDSFLLRKECLS